MFFAENKWWILIHQCFINVWKLNLIDFSSSKLWNKHQLTLCWSLCIAHNPHQANSKAPRKAEFFPYTTCKITLIGCFVCGLIHYAAGVTVWKSSPVRVDAKCGVQFWGCFCVPPTARVDEFPPGHPNRQYSLHGNTNRSDVELLIKVLFSSSSTHDQQPGIWPLLSYVYVHAGLF